jgi:uncharacterized membrane protein HdeD (DUF308 family)
VSILRGIFTIGFGLAAILWPGITLLVLIWFFAAYVLIGGLFQIITAFNRRERFSRWWLGFIQGWLGVIIGLITFIWPGITGLTLLMLIIAWALITDILEIAATIQLRKELENEWLLRFAGALSIGLGILMIIWPAASALILSRIIGVYAIQFGGTIILLGLRTRNWRTEQISETDFS